MIVFGKAATIRQVRCAGCGMRARVASDAEKAALSCRCPDGWKDPEVQEEPEVPAPAVGVDDAPRVAAHVPPAEEA